MRRAGQTMGEQMAQTMCAVNNAQQMERWRTKMRQKDQYS